jgi:hypothetical protein
MKIQHWVGLGVIVLALICAGESVAQRRGSVPPPPPPEPQLDLDNTQAKPADQTPQEVGAPAQQGQRTDPLVPSPRLRGVLNPPAPSSANTAHSGAVVVLGRVIAKNKPAMALIQVNGLAYYVSKGSRLPGYKVIDVNRAGVVLESEKGESIRLR